MSTPQTPSRNVSIRALLPGDVAARIGRATALAVPVVDVLAKTKLARSKREARRLLSEGPVTVDGALVPPNARDVDIHIGTVIIASGGSVTITE